MHLLLHVAFRWKVESFHQLSNSPQCPLATSKPSQSPFRPSLSSHLCFRVMAKGGSGELPFCPNQS